MHWLDLIMYFVLFILGRLFLPKEFKEEAGAMMGIMFFLFYTIFYLIFFVVIDYNWIDIFHNIYHYKPKL